MILMKTLLVATKNPGKLLEIKKFLLGLPLQIVSLSDVGITKDVEEKGITYKENSVQKAIFYAKKSGLPSIADDGGLEIEALGGAPGISSRRWLGYEASDEVLIKYLKKVSKKLPENNRNAVFRAVITFSLPNGKSWSVEGSIKGIIAKEPNVKLIKGYPYRSFFYLPKIKKYYHESELTPQEEKRYNHRYKAIQKLKPIIIKELGIMT